ARQAFASVSGMLTGESEPGSHDGAINGQWQLDGVEVTYPDSQKPSLLGVSIAIEPGERIAVLGRGGSGKTTLARVLAGLILPERGLVKLDQIELKRWSNASRAAGIGYLPQQPGFFAGSVRDNVLWGLEAVDEARLQRAAELSGLSRFLADWAAGWDQGVGEGGGELSGSQRTAVALARLIVRDTATVVMDEPTSNLDARSEVELRANLKPWLDGRGLVLVTHRSAMLAWVDRIVVVEGGRIVADGPKEEVLTMLKMKQAQA
ncbi:MAG: ATP-binding cassette domain-containing protein, partial [Litorivicinus sp.]